ncbi:probable amidase At4g34880 [Prosopis cineraria]|uniref:probable amidase At4g34880 n=1 Tax=Prosopis cineraria TaxID=364024 RepID=UPI00240F16D0|nr:probable amidase At4g34880 [Prosopis cineraria]
MRTKHSSQCLVFSLVLQTVFLTGWVKQINGSNFSISEATIDELHKALDENKLTSTQLVDFYLQRITSFNPILRSVLEVNPDARDQAEERQRSDPLRASSLGSLRGIPVLLKDGIATDDKLNTSAGSFALLGSKVPRDAHEVEKLRRAGAVILGKASLSEWYGTRSLGLPSNWCARGGFALNPYVESGNTCGSSFGSAISVATNMVAVSLGTETDGSIICPADLNSVVGIKPTVGLTSRAGVIPVSPRQDTIGPICRTVSDAVHVLDVIVGLDPRDEATNSTAAYIPQGGYKKFLRKEGLEGKRLGVVRNPFSHPYNGSLAISVFENHLNTMRERGATVVDNLEIANIGIIQNPFLSGEFVALLAEFKLAVNEYLKDLISSPVRSLADIIQFNIDHPDLEKTEEYGQEMLIASEMTSGFGEEEVEAVKRMEELSREGFEKVMKENQLDGLVTLGSDAATMLAIGGYPAITVPGGYDQSGMPFGICFGGLKGSEPKLIQIAFDFEQSTMARKPPPSSLASF